MGKHTHHVSVPNGHHVWGLMLHAVKSPDWHYVKRRLPHMKHGDENPRNKNIYNADKLQETSNGQVNNSQVQELRQGDTTNKSSARARIKSLVNGEFTKRKKGQHLHTPTYTVRSQLKRIYSIHHLKALHRDFLVDLTSTDGSPETSNKNNEDSNTIISMDSLPEKSFEEPISSRETGDACQVDENERLHRENNTPLQENLDDERQASLEHSMTNTNDITTDASLFRSKDFVNALDTSNMNKEFFMNKEDVNRSCEKEEDIHKQSIPSIVVEYREDVIRKVNPAADDIANSSFSDSAHHFNNPGKNEVVIKRFKDLKQKIKHAINERKNERHRITMDAILHKIPHNQGFSKDLNNEILDQLKDPSMLSDSKCSPNGLKSYCSALIGKRCHSMRRISSLNERLDRYCQLYESTINREAREPVCGRLKLRREDEALSFRNSAKSLGRIFSLPEIRFNVNQNDDLCGACSSWMLVRIPSEETGSKSIAGEQNNTDMPLTSDYCLQLDNPVETQIQENLVEVSETNSCTGDQVGLSSAADSIIEMDKLSDDLITLTTRDSASDGEWDIKAKANEPSPVSVFDFNSQDVGESTAEFSFLEESEEMLEFIIPGVDDSLTGHQRESSMDAPLMVYSSDFEKIEFLPHVQVEAEDKAKFDYVKYILELTGFSGNEPLGTWHSDDQHLDPSVYEEVGGCILLDPDCSGNEVGKCNHKFFFNLINEVLMEIYERSHSLYPKPLSSQCHIPQMPAGNHVLKEVWRKISRYLSLRPELDQSLDYILSIDLSKNDGWMNLQFNSECVALEVEDLIFNELLEELIYS